MNCASKRLELVTRADAVDQVSSKTDPSTSPQPVAIAITPLVTKDDFAAILQIDKRTFDRMRSAGKLPKPDLTIGRFPRWKASTIAELIERGGTL